MANIDTELNTIATGIYGEDIRSALHDAIFKVNQNGGGGGGTSDYNALDNLPKINNVTLTGNKSSSALGLASASDLNSKISEPSADGTSGQVLATDGTGGRYWKTVSGGGGGASDYNDLTSKPKINNVELTGDKTSSQLGLSPAEHTHVISDVTNLQTSLNAKANSATTLAGYGITDAYTTSAVDTALSGKISEPSTEGTSGQVLMTDGAGGRSWASVSGGSSNWDSLTGKPFNTVGNGLTIVQNALTNPSAAGSTSGGVVGWNKLRTYVGSYTIDESWTTTDSSSKSTYTLTLDSNYDNKCFVVFNSVVNENYSSMTYDSSSHTLTITFATSRSRTLKVYIK